MHPREVRKGPWEREREKERGREEKRERGKEIENSGLIIINYSSWNL